MRSCGLCPALEMDLRFGHIFPVQGLRHDASGAASRASRVGLEPAHHEATMALAARETTETAFLIAREAGHEGLARLVVGQTRTR